MTDGAPPPKRGKLQDFELAVQFVPHVDAKGLPVKVSKFIQLADRPVHSHSGTHTDQPNPLFCTCTFDQIKVWALHLSSHNETESPNDSDDGQHQWYQEHGSLHNLKRFTRGYTVASVPAGTVSALPKGGFVATGIASPHERSEKLLVCNLECCVVREIPAPAAVAGGVVSLASAPNGHVFVGGLEGTVVEVVLLPGNGDKDAQGKDEGNAGVFSASCELQVIRTMPGHEGEVEVFTGLPGGAIACGSAGTKLIAEGTTDSRLRIWNGGALLKTYEDHLEFPRAFCSCLGVGVPSAANNTSFVTGSSDGTFIMRRVDGSVIKRYALPLNWMNERASILAIACVHNGNSYSIVTADDDKPGRACVWDPKRGLLQTIPHPNEVSDVVVFAGTKDTLEGNDSGFDNSQFLTACRDGVIRLWTRNGSIAAPAGPSRKMYIAAVKAAFQNRKRLQDLQSAGANSDVSGGGTVDGVQYEHTMAIALDSDSAGSVPFRFGFNQFDFYKEVASMVAMRHSLNEENLLQLEKAIRAQQEQATGPPRNLGPPGEREMPVRLSLRQYKFVRLPPFQQSGGGHAELAKKIVKVNEGLRTRGRECALSESRITELQTSIKTLQKSMQLSKTPLAPTFYRDLQHMLQTWPPKTLFVPFGLLRIAALRTNEVQTIASPDFATLGLQEILKYVHEALEANASNLVCASALLALVNIFSASDPQLCRQLCLSLSKPPCVGLLNAIVQRTSELSAAGSDASVLQTCLSLCINVIHLLRRTQRSGTSKNSEKLASCARDVAASLLTTLMAVASQSYADIAPSKTSVRTTASYVLCGLVNLGVIDSQAAKIWTSLEKILRDAFQAMGDKAMEEVDCLLRYRGPVFEAV